MLQIINFEPSYFRLKDGRTLVDLITDGWQVLGWRKDSDSHPYSEQVLLYRQEQKEVHYGRW